MNPFFCLKKKRSTAKTAFTYKDGDELREWIEEQMMADILAGRSQCLYRIMEEEKRIIKTKEEEARKRARGPSEAREYARRRLAERKHVFSFIPSEVSSNAVRNEVRRIHFFENFEKRFWVF